VKTQQHLYQDKHFTDVTLVGDDDIQVTAHKIVLSSCSPVFRRLLQNNPHPHPLLYMRGIKHHNLQSILQYMYCGEVRIFQEDMDEFISVSNDLKVKDLCNVPNSEFKSYMAMNAREEPEESFVDCNTTDDGDLLTGDFSELKPDQNATSIPHKMLPNKKKKNMQTNSVAAYESVTSDGTHQLAYDPLPCSPYSPHWKSMGTNRVRGVLRRILVTAGYGRNGRECKLGVGDPPLGWPADIDWAGFKGSTRSGLKVLEISRIIVSMLEAAGFDPETHVRPVDEYLDSAEDAIKDCKVELAE